MLAVGRQDGSAVLGLLGPLLVGLLVSLVVVVDLGAYAAAVSRAQAAADAVALAAALAAHPDARPSDDPTRAARHLAIEAGGDLVRCDCPRRRHAEVVVVVRFRVGGLVIPRVWARSVDATASARAVLEAPP